MRATSLEKLPRPAVVLSQTAAPPPLTASDPRRAVTAALTLVAVLVPAASAAAQPRPPGCVPRSSSASRARRAGRRSRRRRRGRPRGHARQRRGARDRPPAPGVRVRDALSRLRASGSVSWAGRNLLARRPTCSTTRASRRARQGCPGGWQSSQWNLVGQNGINVVPAWDAARPRRGGRPGRQGRGPRHRRRLREPHALPPVAGAPGRPHPARLRLRQPDRFPNDANGHGTFVATSIAGRRGQRLRHGRRGLHRGHHAGARPQRRGRGQLGAHRRGHPLGGQARARVLNVSIELYDPVYFQAQSITQAPRSPPPCATRPSTG
jgi:hypothetical protein